MEAVKVDLGLQIEIPEEEEEIGVANAQEEITFLTQLSKRSLKESS